MRSRPPLSCCFWLVATSWLCASACAPSPTLLQPADPSVDDDASGSVSFGSASFGNDGSFGARLSSHTFRVRGDRVVDADVIAPTDATNDATNDDGAIDVAAGSFPPVLLIQGGLTTVARYHWLAAHIASRGFVVVAPHHVADLAFFSQGDGLDALAALRRAGERSDGDLAGVVDDRAALAIGHSLGGVVASNAWVEDEGGVSHLVLLASVPNPALDLTRRSGRVLSIAGRDDGKISPAEVKEGADAFAAPTTFAVVDGLTHYFLTDDASDDELKDDGDSDVARGEARRRALFLVDAMLASQTGDHDGDIVLDDDTRWTAGVHR